MKMIIGAITVVLSLNAWGGGEVPWPIDQQENLLVRNLNGVWANISATPRMLYYIETEKTKSKACPYLVHVLELSAETSRVLFSGTQKVCTTQKAGMGIILYDSLGRAKKYLDIVGVSSGKKQQNIGLSIYDYNQATIKGDRIEQDLFVKIAVID